MRFWLSGNYLLSLIAACAERYSGRRLGTTAPCSSDSLSYKPSDAIPPFWSFKIGFEEAEKYRKSCGFYLRKNQWEDMTIDLYL
ncbi:MAG: hypothetical protein PHH84_04440 [Oscillospiraceae bacterium]|nr:hypothetical protein [Oscillospiraceae bacterium]MDD4414170.1 hypothetical protein [Oscillospiraceae bacterium]